ncbi:MAG TPA: PEP/pyruvate-binding domain-containing protein [Anaerolineae bacterium]|nr:PEP/pyruvate-binding domain-containing protein [Anaerolineae bacterium]HQI83171.1 PEP/pyruvate-binding domain-containing protein [Anaerolineae bacterium]
MDTIHWLENPDCQDAAVVGGKAANLGKLAETHPVPPGFCFTPEKPGPRGLSPDLYDELVAAYANLAVRCGTPEVRVAVRSSAVDEDGQQTSFAGLHDTYLNVTGPGAVAAAVRRCLASARTPRAQAYRQALGLPEEADVAVLVQQLVVADVSAVVFSADPRTGARDRVVINATWGLGESLVGGTVTPDLYIVRKCDLEILSRQIAEKTCMTVATADGVREVPVPGCMQREPALDNAQIRALADLARTLENSQGWPVDLECAYQKGRLYLLQCRPITTV